MIAPVAWLHHQWQAYWFEVDSRVSLGMCRIGLALALLLSNAAFSIDYAFFLELHEGLPYQPKGLLVFLGQTPPPAAFLNAVHSVAIVSSWLLLVGLFSRCNMWISLFSNLLLASFKFSYQDGWCNDWNIVFLVGIGFLFSRCGESLSIDAWLRSVWWKKPAESRRPAARWPILLGMWGAALVYANASYHKLNNNGFTLDWALSDNLRHIISYRFELIQSHPSRFTSWLLSSSFRYKGAALANFLLQGLPLAACLFARFPRLRAFFGVFFLLETLGLGVMMDIWYPFIFPLYVFFVDWDRLAAWCKSRAFPWLGKLCQSVDGLSASTLARTGVLGRFRMVPASLLIVAYLGYYFYIAFIRYDFTHNSYPFACFPMYSTILAKKPYKTHQDFEWYTYWIDGKDSVNFASLSKKFPWGLVNYSDDDKTLLVALKAARKVMQKEFLKDPEVVTFHGALIYDPPYPARPMPERAYEGIVACLRRDGRFIHVKVAAKTDPYTFKPCLEITSVGLERPTFRVAYILNNTGKPKPLDGVWVGNRYVFETKEPGAYFFCVYVTDPALGDEEVPFWCQG